MTEQEKLTPESFRDAADRLEQVFAANELLLPIIKKDYDDSLNDSCLGELALARFMKMELGEIIGKMWTWMDDVREIERAEA